MINLLLGEWRISAKVGLPRSERVSFRYNRCEYLRVVLSQSSEVLLRMTLTQ
jgi:hypothetical protein